jgi:hypothetical protein
MVANPRDILLPAAGEGLPDVLVIGDSHSNALVEGCLAHGLRVEMFRLSGNLWSAGRVSFHREHGLTVRGAPVVQRQIGALRERLGGRSLLSREVPVLASVGFHLGRLVPPFGMHGHVTEARHFEAKPSALYASASLTDAYLGAFRGEHVRLARQMSRLAPVTYVLPPHFADWGNMRNFALQIASRMRRVGLKVYDPALDLDPSGAPLPRDMLTGALNHGNADYGRAVIGHMLAKGLIKRRG